MITDDSTTREVRATGASAKEPHQPHLFLLFESTRLDAGGARHALGDVDRVTIGRAASREVRRFVEGGERVLLLGVPDRRMSAAHARIERLTSGGFVVQDLESTNGSWLNGHPLGDSVELQDGDIFEAGRTLFLYRANLPTDPGVPSDVDGATLRSEPEAVRSLIPSRACMTTVLRKIAASRVPVLVTGPTGTGKELAARALHAESGRQGSFVAVNAGALAQGLVESQMFGSVRGAFTGAVRDEPGFVRTADGGTLFLDEIADLPLPAQAALLRVLQEGEVTPVGSARPIRVDVRCVAATHADLDERCRAGCFREDLLARLAGCVFELPALRDRREDLGLILATLLQRAAPGIHELSAGVGRALARYRWPRNVRELEQTLSAAAAIASPSGVLTLTHLPPRISAMAVPRGAPPRSAQPGQEDRRRRALLALLAEHRGNLAEVARAMGKARMQIHRWVKRYEIDVSSFRR
jgi:transcriptional regulator with AAA-type ATPase domain